MTGVIAVDSIISNFFGLSLVTGGKDYFSLTFSSRKGRISVTTPVVNNGFIEVLFEVPISSENLVLTTSSNGDLNVGVYKDSVFRDATLTSDI